MAVHLRRGNMASEDYAKVKSLLHEFATIVAVIAKATQARRAAVRSLLPCSMLNLIDSHHLYVAGQKNAGMPSTIALDSRDSTWTTERVHDAAVWDYGMDDPFVVRLPLSLLDASTEQRFPALAAIANTHVASEVGRMHRLMNVIQINPIFGPASYTINPSLAFVLMPFTDELTLIYTEIVKPAVENLPEFGLLCRRANDIKSNKVIMHDIWRSLCEARLVIADLSELNPNVMYELGIAHTLGKETILIYQRKAGVKFPFDFGHIRRIEYDNHATGGMHLRRELEETIKAVLDPEVKSTK